MNKEDYIELSPSKFSQFSGSIRLEKSKSIANRALILQALSGNTFSIDDPGNSDDVQLMKRALDSKDEKINCGMAGTVLRFLSSAFSIIPGTRILRGEGSLMKRPIKPLIDALLELGADIHYLENEGFLPIRIKGKELEGGEIEIDQDISSQFVSSLMMIAPFMKKGLLIKRKGLRRSESYVQLTEKVMSDLSFQVVIEDELIKVLPALSISKKYEIESDWSSAVYWMAFVCLIPDSRILLKGLFLNSEQGDKKLLDVLDHFGLVYEWNEGDLILSKIDKEISDFNCDCSSFPDQAQTLSFLCVALGVECTLSGLETLIYKETNRIEAIKNEVEKLGVKSNYSYGVLNLSIPGNVKNLVIETYEDHRMAMAASLLGVIYPIKIKDPEVVSKSYPHFWSDLEKLTI